MRHTLRSQRLAALFAGGWLMLNFPLLALWDSDRTVAGFPLFPLSLFLVWRGIIATVAWGLGSLPETVSPPPGLFRPGWGLTGRHVAGVLGHWHVPGLPVAAGGRGLVG